MSIKGVLESTVEESEELMEPVLEILVSSGPEGAGGFEVFALKRLDAKFLTILLQLLRPILFQLLCPTIRPRANAIAIRTIIASVIPAIAPSRSIGGETGSKPTKKRTS